MSIIDLHTHSTFSDGTLTPTELVLLAKKKGLSAVALTDHNTVAGLEEFLRAGEKNGVNTVPGIEFSTAWGDCEVHVVALFVGQEHYSAVTSLVESARLAKEESNKRLIAALNRAGYPIDYDELKNSCQGQFNRAHVAARLVEAGAVKDRAEAFSTLLSPKGGYYDPPKRLDTFEVISFIRSIGAVPVLAHPLLNFPPAVARLLADRAKENGLLAMEVYYSTYSPKEVAEAERIARELSLLPSGGSDFHGGNKPGLELGSGYGSLAVPHSVYDALAALIC